MLNSRILLHLAVINCWGYEHPIFGTIYLLYYPTDVVEIVEKLFPCLTLLFAEAHNNGLGCLLGTWEVSGLGILRGHG
jgi:hypothetical protein